ncbi:heavy metal translocating P-type ATPase [Salipaludibacillus sp. CF4.18]|uniref:heavy metal translocating P-type ATPase n=1 Tax=Salipaludibacillus sp. CF4.18 TaxID=3373081 RepID=UPI003EE58050
METTTKTDQEMFKVKGMTCTGCAARFEKNVKQIPGVKEANVNFTSEKLIIEGHASIQELEKAGAFENVKVYHENDELPTEEDQPFFQKHTWIQVIIASLFVLAGWISHFYIGEQALVTIGLFLSGMVIGGYSMFWQGIKNLTKFVFDMKTLMTIAIIGAALIGEWGEGALVVVLFAISEALESYSMDRARKSIRSLVETSPRNATVNRLGNKMVVPVDEIDIGEEIIIRPGEKIPLDGTVTKGLTSVNQAAITGESIPVGKGEGDSVFAGTLNEEGLLSVKVTKLVKDTTLAKIIQLVEEAQGERAPAQQFIDRFAAYYTPAIMILAFIVMVGPPLLAGGVWSEWIYLGLATLVVGCPCALVISTPVAIVTAIGSNAKQGILIRGGIHLEQAGHIEVISFDKTGTLTKGTPEVTDFLSMDDVSEKELIPYIYSIEEYSTHPLAKTLVAYAKKNGGDLDSQRNVTDSKALTGKGMSAKIDGVYYYVASPSYVRSYYSSNLSEKFNEMVEDLQKQGKTVVILGNESRILAILALRDEVRPEAKHAIQQLKKLGIKEIVMLTGDQRYTAEAIGREAGVTRVESELLPEEKLAFIKQTRISGKNVAMVGDGMNDAPALAQANVGIAMGGGGTDTAIETADIALMGDELNKLPILIETSRRTLRIVKQNIAFALGLKVLALILVPFGWLTLWIAIIADMGATLLVTFNSLRLIKIKDKSNKK